MRGSDIDQSLKMSILLDLAHIGGTNFNLPNGTYKLMEDKYEVKLILFESFGGFIRWKLKRVSLDCL